MSSHLISSGYLTTIFGPFGEQRKKMRRILTHEFLSPQKLQWLYGKRVEGADNLVQYVHNQCKNLDKCGLVNGRIATQQYCGNVIRKMIFNMSYFSKSDHTFISSLGSPRSSTQSIFLWSSLIGASPGMQKDVPT
ncbi:hypothetical protein L6164_030732 [Bauhinia variegata]|uniref:Uncharacterized protein n=1 Tax=Bauhinia variegata TaxID=167791 RepID=A0ACB9LEJ4_BAUVA|nr:hypothetical protein L6164_030732 [Bauhinia variegata]